MDGNRKIIAVFTTPLVLLACALFGAQLVWTAVNFRAPVGPPVLISLPMMILSGLMPVAFRRAWTTPGLAAPAKQFWRALTLASVVNFVAILSDLSSYIKAPAPSQNPLRMAMFLLTFAWMLWALFRVPFGARNQGDRLRLFLDAGSVALAVLLITSYCSLAQLPGTPTGQQLTTTIVFSISLAVITLGIAKVLLSGDRSINPIALGMVGIGLGAEIVAMLAMPLVVDRPQISIEQTGRCGMYVIVTVASMIQRHGGLSGSGPVAKAIRYPISSMPYLAVAAVDAVLLLGLHDAGGAILGVGLGAVALTGVVIIRQLTAFRENTRLLARLGHQESRFRSLVQNASDVIAIIGAPGVLTYISPGIERLTGQPASHWIGTCVPPVRPEDIAGVVEKLHAVRDAGPGATISFDTRTVHPARGTVWVNITFTNLLHDPAVAGIIANLSDITGTRLYQDQLAYQASHDSLTGLANRALFSTEVQQAIDAGVGDHQVLALIDLDDFKAVNDTFGHSVGDGLLTTVADRLSTNVRPGDVVARLGGDEFAVLFSNVDTDQVEAVTQRLLAMLHEPLTIAGNDLHVTASLGFATSSRGDDVGQLLHRADLAMYTAKAAGKGRCARYTDAMARTPYDAASAVGAPGPYWQGVAAAD